MKIMIVDDVTMQRVLLTSLLRSKGYTDIVQADSAERAFDLLGMNSSESDTSIDLILMDLYMPKISGLEAIQRIKAVDALHDIPIIVVTASEGINDLEASFDAGAMDYITKPPNMIELSVRVRSALKLKHETDQRKEREERLNSVLGELKIEQEKSESLLLNTLPQPIAARLKEGQQVIADGFPEATVLFSDVVDFTSLSSELVPEELVTVLNELFGMFDVQADRLGLEKIKTMGDAYIAVSGVPTPRPDHIEAAAEMALAVREEIKDFGGYVQVRMGLHTGPVVAGVIGTRKFAYDLWGDTVNVASRMQSLCAPGEIYATEQVYEKLRARYDFVERGLCEVKGKGAMQTYLLVGRK